MDEMEATLSTIAHINRVRELMNKAAVNIIERGRVHDASKLQPPEREAFASVTHELAAHEYGTPGYNAAKAKLGDALGHHYANNSHHPEHWADGVNGMSLFDVIEMLLDWKAAGERQKNGSIVASIDFNRERFKISPQLEAILRNTAAEMGWMSDPAPLVVRHGGQKTDPSAAPIDRASPLEFGGQSHADH